MNIWFQAWVIRHHQNHYLSSSVHISWYLMSRAISCVLYYKNSWNVVNSIPLLKYCYLNSFKFIVYGCCACVYTSASLLLPGALEVRKSIWYSGTGLTDDYEPPCWLCELCLGHLEKQRVLGTLWHLSCSCI